MNPTYGFTKIGMFVEPFWGNNFEVGPTVLLHDARRFIGSEYVYEEVFCEKLGLIMKNEDSFSEKGEEEALEM